MLPAKALAAEHKKPPPWQGSNDDSKQHHMRITPRAVALLTAVSLVAPLSAWADEIGRDTLVARLGAATPTGANVGIGQVEALESAGNFGPNRLLAEFAGKSFIDMSGSSGTSSHATFVGQNAYGTATSIAPGVSSIWVYEAASFAQTANLNFGNSIQTPLVAPSSPVPLRIFNHSWIGSFGNVAFDNEVLRRADYAMNRDGTLFVCGENNGAGSAMSSLMSCGYNGIAVGLTSGGHSAGDIATGVDGTGRMKPELVAPGQFTSFSTPVVSAAAALMYETTNTLPYSSNINRRKGVTIKSALMCGATHSATWQNQTPTSGPNRGITVKPIDPIYGAGTVNVDRSHRILTGLEATASSTATSAAVASAQPLSSWDYEIYAPGTQRHYRIDLNAAADVSVLLAWNRVPGMQWTSGSAPGVLNLRLELKKVIAGVPTSITGDAGIGLFASGNVVSASAVDNVEHLYIKALSAGSYVLSVTRDDVLSISAGSAVSWFVDLPVIFGDIDGSGSVNGADLGLLLGAWGTSGPGDLNNDGVVNGADLGLLLGSWT